MWVVLEFNSDLLLNRRWQVSIDFLIFYTTNSRLIVQTPPFLENVYWNLYYIIARAIFKTQVDILYSVFRILPSSDSWAWVNRQEDFENAQYSPLHGLRCTTCLVHTKSHPRFFCENVNEIVSRPARRYSAHIVGQKETFIWGKCWVNRVLCVKTWVVSFVLMSAHKQVHFWGYWMYISDMNFLWSSANIIVNNKK